MSGKNLDLNYGESPVDYLDKKLEPSRTMKGSTKKKSSPNHKGCSGNDGNEHVYAHVLDIYLYNDGSKREYHHWGPCIGCENHCGGRKATRKKPIGTPDVINTWKFDRPNIWHGFRAYRV